MKIDSFLFNKLCDLNIFVFLLCSFIMIMFEVVLLIYSFKLMFFMFACVQGFMAFLYESYVDDLKIETAF